MNGGSERTKTTLVRIHTITNRNGTQVMVKGLSLRRQLDYGPGAHVIVESISTPLLPKWDFIVATREHATLCSRHPPPPDWIRKGEEVRISITPAAGTSPSSATVSNVSSSRFRPAATSTLTSYPATTPAQVVSQLLSPNSFIDSSDAAQFDVYLFSDYSGAQKPSNAIVPAIAIGAAPAMVIAGSFNRSSLVDLFVSFLRAAEQRGLRLLLGVDHQYGVPIAIGRELGLATLTWRTFLEEFSDGETGGRPPLPDQQGLAARELNQWLRSQGRPDYFWSATKGGDYQIPKTDPRGGVADLQRLTERRLKHGAAMRFNRLGDPGTIGGQTLVGLPHLRMLLDCCRTEGIAVKAWPFDSLCLSDPLFDGAHVLVEMYPSAVRPEDVAQTDAADAIESVTYMQRLDQAGELIQLADLSTFPLAEQNQIRFEGWILAEHHPL